MKIRVVFNPEMLIPTFNRFFKKKRPFQYILYYLSKKKMKIFDRNLIFTINNCDFSKKINLICVIVKKNIIFFKKIEQF